MFTISLAEAFITIFIGMGPVKVLLIYIAETKELDKETKRAMATRIVLVAGGVGVGLFILGALLQQILHFSIGALNIIGGLILLLLALNMVFGGKPEGIRGRRNGRRPHEHGHFAPGDSSDFEPGGYCIPGRCLITSNRPAQFHRHCGHDRHRHGHRLCACSCYPIVSPRISPRRSSRSLRSSWAFC